MKKLYVMMVLLSVVCAHGAMYGSGSVPVATQVFTDDGSSSFNGLIVVEAQAVLLDGIQTTENGPPIKVESEFHQDDPRVLISNRHTTDVDGDPSWPAQIVTMIDNIDGKYSILLALLIAAGILYSADKYYRWYEKEMTKQLSYEQVYTWLQTSWLANYKKSLDLKKIATLLQHASYRSLYLLERRLKSLVDQRNKEKVGPIDGQQNQITIDMVRNSFIELVFGPLSAAPSYGQEKLNAAIYQAGHAISMIYRSKKIAVASVSVDKHERVDGYVWNIPVAKSTPWNMNDRIDYIIVLLSGGAAENLYGSYAIEAAKPIVFDGVDHLLNAPAPHGVQQISSGLQAIFNRKSCTVDLEKAKLLVRSVLEHDMHMKHYTDNDVNKILEECYYQATLLVQAHKDSLDALITQLLEKTTLEDQIVYKICKIKRPLYPFELVQVKNKKK